MLDMLDRGAATCPLQEGRPNQSEPSWLQNIEIIIYIIIISYISIVIVISRLVRFGSVRFKVLFGRELSCPVLSCVPPHPHFLFQLSEYEFKSSRLVDVTKACSREIIHVTDLIYIMAKPS